MKILVAGLIFLFICGLIGAITGAFRILVSVFLLVLCILGASYFSPKVSGFLNKSFSLESRASQNVQRIVDKHLGDKVDTMDPKKQEKKLEKLHLPASWQNEIKKHNNSEWMIENEVNTFRQLVVKTVGRNMAVNFAFVLVSFVGFLVLRLLVTLLHLMDLLLKLPILKGANRFTGFVIGIILGVFLLNVILAGLPLMQQYDWGQRIVNALNANWFTGFIYRHNLLVWFLSGR